jgi:hypothetical protein
MKNIQIHKLLLGLSILVLFGTIATLASQLVSAYKDGVYINISGGMPSDPDGNLIECTDNCNQYYKNSEADCNPDQGYCTPKDPQGGNSWYVHKVICDGKPKKGDPPECGGKGKIPQVKELTKQEKLTVDGDGVKCNQTVQLDVFSKNCYENGQWICKSEDLKGFMAWYSGACPAETPIVPACNTDCSSNPNICQQATGGCTTCADNSSGGKTCQPPVVPACNTDCTSNPNICQQASGGCTVCADNASGGGKSCQPPTNQPPVTNPPVSPTPDFSEAMCKCDGMTVSQIIPGQPAVFTATAKVTGSDVTKAEAKQIEFTLGVGNDPANRKLVAGPDRVNTTSSGTSTEMKYTAQWTVNIPAAVQKDVEYHARAAIKCTRKTTAQAYPFTAMVLSESESKGGLFATIADFIRNLFNRSDEKVPSNSSENKTQSSEEQDFVSIAEQNNIQLGSFAPAKVIENKCPVVKFKFQ